MKISVILFYNTDRGWLKEAKQSILDQTYKGEIEVIVSHSNNGASFNLNRGIQKATGEVIKYLCDDDMLTPNCLQDVADYYKANPDVDFTHGKAHTFWANKVGTGQHIPENKTPNLRELFRRNHIHGGTLAYRKECFTKFGLFDEGLFTGEEYEYNLRMLSKGAKIGYIDSFLYQYRRHDGQKSTGNRKAWYKAQRVEAMQAMKKKYLELI